MLKWGIMKILLSSLLAVSCINCSKFKSIENYNIDSAFKPYIKQYVEVKERETGFTHTSNPSIAFKSLEGPVIGLCYWYFNGKREIFIDPEYWFSESTTDYDRRLLIFHEMGHCDLDRGHNGPSSIMEEYHIGGFIYQRHMSYFDQELFGSADRKDVTIKTFNKSNDHSSCGGIIHKKLN